MNGAGILIKALEAEGVEIIFGYPGGAIMPVYDALVDTEVRHILVRHEQAAAHAAEGYARASGKVGVCFATSGPGATNLVTGLANAFLDSVPMVAVTGQVAAPLMGTDAFQEVDIYGISMPVVKHSFIVRDVKELADIVAEAFEIARSGRPGPVLIDLPKDVALAEVDLSELPEFRGGRKEAVPRPEARQLNQAREMLATSKKPIVYAGGGVRIAGASEQLRNFVEATGIPVVTTLHGIGAVDGDHPLCLGMLGMHGSKEANLSVQECDLLIAVGARFDDRVTGKLAEFAPEARVIHLDGDPSEVSKLRAADCPVVGNIKTSLNFLHMELSIEEWVAKCLARKEEFSISYDAPGDFVYAPGFLNQLASVKDRDLHICCDVGQHQMWVAQHCKFDDPRKHISSGGLGTMGFGLPAAVGAQFANSESLVVTVSGDGSIMMNIQELATLKRYNIPVKVVVFDNQALGMVRQWQELFFNERYSEVDLSDNPDFAELAKAFGIPAITVKDRADVAGAIEKIQSEPGPMLVHVMIDPRQNVWPLVPPGRANSEMLEETSA